MRYVLAGFAGAVLAVFLIGAAPATQDVVRCRRVEIVDGQGALRQVMYVDAKTGAARLVVFGEEGVAVNLSAGAMSLVSATYPDCSAGMYAGPAGSAVVKE